MRDSLRPQIARLFVATIIATGAGLLVWLTTRPGALSSGTWDLAVVTLVAGVILGEIAPVKVGPDQGEVAPSTPFAFALMMTVGIAGAVGAQACASVLADIRDRKPLSRTAFNAAQYVISLWLSWLILSAIMTPTVPARFGPADLIALALAGSAFFAFNTGVVAIAVSLHTGIPLRRQFSSDLFFHAGTEAILVGLAPLAVLAVDYSPAVLPLLVLPLLAINRAGRHAVLSERLALHDTLTDLPNRVLFLDRVSLALAAAKRRGRSVSVMLIDLDRFKEINDTLGHHVGDDVLRQVSARLRAALRDSDTVARLGGDEFGILLGEDSEDAESVARKLTAAVSAPLELSGIPFVADASIGIATYPCDGPDVDTLLQRADVAMYQAKSSDRHVQTYVSENDGNSIERLRMAGELRVAIENEAVGVHFQPQLDPRDGRLVGVEALVRWHPERDDGVTPEEFVRVAEQTGLILPLTIHVLNVTARELARWRAAGLAITAAVNLSGRTLSRADLPERFADICRRWNIPPSSIVLEITESMVASDPCTTIPVIERLAASGATMSIDDFGTGYSSLEYLKVLPVRELKIDRSFVTSMQTDHRDAGIVRSTIELAHGLGLRVVAEGVEDLATNAQLVLLKCDRVQGFHYSAAMPAAEITRRWADPGQHASETGGQPQSRAAEKSPGYAA